ncbi:MAG: tautomerase family protein [Candidatus Margulisiibacteriota bacterium]|jgi:hypothetical protein
MPILKITIPSKKSQEFQKDLLEITEESLKGIFQVTQDQITTMVTLADAQDQEQSQTVNTAIVIEIIAYRGRDFSIKQQLFQTIYEKLNKLYTIEKKELIIYLVEIEKENYFAS